MKYARLTAITILLSAGAADTADAVAYKDIPGQWCGDVTDYVFTPNTLTVKFKDGRPANAFKITKYTYTNDSVSIDWVNAAGKSSVTVFGGIRRRQAYRHGATTRGRQAASGLPSMLRLRSLVRCPV